jgi:phenylacetate-CoA ligase
MSEIKMKEYVETIQRKKPEIIIAYTQSAEELAMYINKINYKFSKSINVMTSAGTLYDHQRKIIKKAFGGEVFNKYGSREASDMACECKKHEGLHVNILTHYLELLDDNLRDVKVGDIYVTCLDNFAMPFIRYKIGDRGSVENKACPCERGFPLFKKIEGRSMDFLRNANGKFIPAEFFIHFIGVVFNKGYIDRFQVIQNSLEKITIKIVLKKNQEFEKYKLEIEKNIQKVFETPLKIEWKMVDKIETEKSGKFRYIINNL